MKAQTILLSAALLVAVLFSGCSRKTTPTRTQFESTTETTTETEILPGAVTVADTTRHEASTSADSAADILNAYLAAWQAQEAQTSDPQTPPAVNSPAIVLNSSTVNGVTTRLSIKGGRLVCEATIDSLRAVIDSLQKVTTTKKTTTSSVIVEGGAGKKAACDSWFHGLAVRWFWLSIGLVLVFVVVRYRRALFPFLFLAVLTLQGCAQGSWGLYTAMPDNYWAQPLIMRKAADSLRFDVKLSSDWLKLYDLSDRCTQKISGVIEVGNKNSVRLGVRCAPIRRPGLVAVFYLHNAGVVSYDAIKDKAGKPLIVYPDSVYTCKIVKEAESWSLSLYNTRGEMLGKSSAVVSISQARYYSGPYLELCNGSLPFSVRTWLRFY